MSAKDPAVNWLLESKDPSVRYLTLTEVLDVNPDSDEARAAKKQIPTGPMFRRLVAGQDPDGGFGVHPYQKWTGAHWRLVSLVELGIPQGHPAAVKAAGQVLDWLTADSHRRRIKSIDGLTLRCASQEGNALAVCSRLGLIEDYRVRLLAESLVKWQWPDGGWNCDWGRLRKEVKHSSFYETLPTLWGLTEYHRATGISAYKTAADRAAEFFLKHRLFRSERSGEIIDPKWLKLHYPLYWHYDILQALMILSRAGKLNDPRTKEALDVVEGKKDANSLWGAEGYYWYPKGRVRVMGKRRIISNSEVVDWGRKGPNKMITLNALRVLKASGRIK